MAANGDEAVDRHDVSTRSLLEAIQGGDYREQLVAIRDKLTRDMEAAAPNVAPQFVSKLLEVLAQINELPNPQGSAVDDLVARRQARRAKADAGMRAKRARREESGN